MNELTARHIRTKQTVEKFHPKLFRWGGCDCGKIAIFHLRKFGWPLPKVQPYSSAVTAKTTIKKLGGDTLPDVIDIIGLPRIPAAFARIGDIVSFPTDDPIGGIGVVVGNGKMMAFHEEYPGTVMMTMDHLDRAWNIWREGSRG